jgi:hypothetical protein
VGRQFAISNTNKLEMDRDFNKVMANKSDHDLLEIGSNYKKFTKDALIAFLSELKIREIETPNTIEIENWIKELEVKNENVGKITGKIELHPNIQLVAKLILLGIPISIAQSIISVFYLYQASDSISFGQVFSMLFLSLILIWGIIFLVAAWIKSGTSVSRIIIGILTAVSVITNASHFINTANEEGMLLGSVSVINLLRTFYILYLLFNKESSNWYKSGKKFVAFEPPKAD